VDCVCIVRHSPPFLFVTRTVAFYGNSICGIVRDNKAVIKKTAEIKETNNMRKRNKMLAVMLSGMLALSASLTLVVANAPSLTTVAAADESETTTTAGETTTTTTASQTTTTTAAAGQTQYKYYSDGTFRYCINDDGKTVKVASPNTETYSGAMKLPASVTIGQNDATTLGVAAGEYQITSIWGESFKYRKELTSLDMSSTSITSIGNRAFSSCEKLVSIKVPSTLKTVGEDAFAGCSKLTSIEVPCNFDVSIFSNVSSSKGYKFTVDTTNYTFEIKSGEKTISSGTFNRVHSFGSDGICTVCKENTSGSTSETTTAAATTSTDGTSEISAVVASNVSDASVSTDAGVAITSYGFSAEELAQYTASGETTPVKLAIDAAAPTSTVQNTMISEAASAIGTSSLNLKALFLDLTLTKTFGDKGTVTNLDQPVSITVSLTTASGLKVSGASTANYKVVRLHDGVTTVITPDSYNPTTGALTFKTDRFSTYAVIYSTVASAGSSNDYDDDAATVTKAATKAVNKATTAAATKEVALNSGAGAGNTADTSAKAPQTGDSTNVMLLVSLMAAALGLGTCGVCVAKKKAK
jgi:hypothetical protein